MLGYKTSLSEFKMIKVTQNMFYDHNEVKLERKKGRNMGNPKYLEIKQSIST